MRHDGRQKTQVNKRMNTELSTNRFSEKDLYQKELLKNRLLKRLKHLQKWARRNDITCYRLYDKDIPEIPLAIDVYRLLHDDSDAKTYILLYLYQRPYEKPQEEELLWLACMKEAICEVTEVDDGAIIVKTRQKQKGLNQYEKTEQIPGIQGIVREQGHSFYVNLGTYLDTGLFFDHRPLRKNLESLAYGKSILNLFCYTGSFSVYGAAGGAPKITSVDLSNTYLEWAKKNFRLNGFDSPSYRFIRQDVIQFLDTSKDVWDIIILDPPTFSNSKKIQGTLDINRDWPVLVTKCIDHLALGGVLYFSTNSKHLQFSSETVTQQRKQIQLEIKDITTSTIPEDFKNTKIHRCWSIKRLP